MFYPLPATTNRLSFACWLQGRLPSPTDPTLMVFAAFIQLKNTLRLKHANVTKTVGREKEGSCCDHTSALTDSFVVLLEGPNCMFQHHLISWIDLHFSSLPSVLAGAHFKVAPNCSALGTVHVCAFLFTCFVLYFQLSANFPFAVIFFFFLNSSQEPAEQKTRWCQSKFFLPLTLHMSPFVTTRAASLRVLLSHSRRGLSLSGFHPIICSRSVLVALLAKLKPTKNRRCNSKKSVTSKVCVMDICR